MNFFIIEDNLSAYLKSS